MIVHTCCDQQQISVPETAFHLTGFRAWVYSDQHPHAGQVTFCDGQVFIDMGPEKFDTHNQVKAEVNRVLAALVRKLDLGKYCPDGVCLTNVEAGLSTEPDGMFLSWRTLQEGKVKFVPAGEEDFDAIELLGSPNWVMEVVSNSSVAKDTNVLLDAYQRAGIQEYWLIDARSPDIRFTIFRNAPAGFVELEPIAGWTASNVFKNQFRLLCVRDRIGHWQYTLEPKTSV